MCIKEKSSSTKSAPGNFPLFLTAEKQKTADRFDYDNEAVCIPLISSKGHGKAAIKRIHYVNGKYALADLLVSITPKDHKTLNTKYLYYILDHAKDKMALLMKGAANVSMKVEDLFDFEIPILSIDLQNELVREIEEYQNVINGARMVVENYRPRIEVDPSWPVVKLGEVCEINPKKNQVSSLNSELLVSFVPMSVINENNEDFFPTEEKPLEEVYKGYTYFQNGDVVLAKVTPCFENGKAGIAKNLRNDIGFGSSELIIFRPNDSILAKWIYIYVTTNEFRKAGKQHMTGTGGLQRVPTSFVADYMIPCPRLRDQEEVLKAIEMEQNHIESLTQLINVYEQKIKNKIAKVWGE